MASSRQQKNEERLARIKVIKDKMQSNESRQAASSQAFQASLSKARTTQSAEESLHNPKVQQTLFKQFPEKGCEILQAIATDCQQVLMEDTPAVSLHYLDLSTVNFSHFDSTHPDFKNTDFFITGYLNSI